jgi:AcrR family transcriptional regulator
MNRMAPLNEEQLHKHRDERKELIIQAALKVFSRFGIDGTKMSMIATEAGVSQGLFYRYFKSKNELFTMLIKEAMEESLTVIEKIDNLPLSPKDKIRILTESILDEGGKHYFMLIHQAHTSSGVPEKAKQLLEQYPIKLYIDRLLPLFVEGQEEGEIVEGNLEELISSYLSILSGVMVINSQDNRFYQKPNVNLLMRILTKN